MRPFSIIVAAAACTASSALPALGQIQPAPYQGTLRNAGTLVNGAADFQLRLFNSPAGSVQVGPTLDLSAVGVVDGRFAVPIDFGPAVFHGEDRYLEIAVRSPAGTGNFVILTPRQRIDPVPHAQRVPGLDGHSLDAPDGSPVDALVVDGSGSVGIGSSPSGRFEVHSGSNSYARVDSVHGDLHVNGGSDRIAGIWNDSTGVDARTDIIVNNWPQMVVNGGGGVGIGTLNPLRRFTVVDGGLFTARFENVGPLFTGVEFINTAAGQNAGLLVGPTGRLNLHPNVSQVVAAVGIEANSWVSLGDEPGPAAFRLEMMNFGGPDGRARANQWVTFSSARWKENVLTLDGALDKVMQLRGVSFDWKPEHGGKRDIGFVAEEVGKIVPEIVSWEKDGQWAQGLAYDRITALAVEAIEEQQQTLEGQRRAGDALGRRLEDLRQRVAAREVERGAQPR